MKILTLSLLLMVLVGCSTNPIQRNIIAQQEIIEATIKEDKIIGDSLPSWTRKSGIENGMVYVVGVAEFDANKSPFYIQKAAQMDAETKLLSDAPADFRVITQNAMTGVGIDSAEYYQVQTKLQEVIGLVGIKIDQDKITCRKMIRYGNLSTRLTRVCYVQAFISAQQLAKAYKRTLALKFGEYKANEFKNLMNQELKQINKNPLLRSSHEESTTSHNANDSHSANYRSTRLPAQQVEIPQRQSEVYPENSQRRYISASRVSAKE